MVVHGFSSSLDPDVLVEVNRYVEGIKKIMSNIIGSTLVKLQGGHRGDVICRRTECTLGNLITDAMIWRYTNTSVGKKWNNISMAVINGGAIRASIDKGNSTRLENIFLLISKEICSNLTVCNLFLLVFIPPKGHALLDSRPGCILDSKKNHYIPLCSVGLPYTSHNYSVTLPIFDQIFYQNSANIHYRM